ncbi:PREDICTED: uncharacterized protein C10orf91 homolog [Colobus angolensis palliatus]|uniref:Uncharacterized protein n=1 Tax=Colobus angolensis palliatus TaxID=336983 RepID=A0A2K5K8E5_COLAP|nr:PREDICTED: uncharacterized protein C10orf91 homolog [Colobus angolensis palliatus]
MWSFLPGAESVSMCPVPGVPSLGACWTHDQGSGRAEDRPQAPRIAQHTRVLSFLFIQKPQTRSTLPIFLQDQPQTTRTLSPRQPQHPSAPASRHPRPPHSSGPDLAEAAPVVGRASQTAGRASSGLGLCEQVSVSQGFRNVAFGACSGEWRLWALKGQPVSLGGQAGLTQGERTLSAHCCWPWAGVEPAGPPRHSPLSPGEGRGRKQISCQNS